MCANKTQYEATIIKLLVGVGGIVITWLLTKHMLTFKADFNIIVRMYNNNKFNVKSANSFCCCNENVNFITANS